MPDLGLITTFCILAIAVAAAGLCAGFLAGFLGVGGGIILVPMLFYAFAVLGVDEAVRMHMAVGTSLAVIIPTSIRSLTTHRTKGAVDDRVLQVWAVPVVLGVVIGALIANAVEGGTLTLIFAILAILLSLHLAFSPDHWRLGDRMPGRSVMAVFGSFIGLFSTLIGIGGGSFGVSLMTLYGQPIHRAVGTSSGLGIIISIPATIGFIWAGWGEPGRPILSLGFVNLAAWALTIPMTVLAVPHGAKLAHRIDRQLLRRAFAAFLAVNAVILLSTQVL